MRRKFRLDTKKNFFPEEWLGIRPGCPRRFGVTIPGGFNKHINVALRDTVRGHCGNRLELDDLSGFFPSVMILFYFYEIPNFLTSLVPLNAPWHISTTNNIICISFPQSELHYFQAKLYNQSSR